MHLFIGSCYFNASDRLGHLWPRPHIWPLCKVNTLFQILITTRGKVISGWGQQPAEQLLHNSLSLHHVCCRHNPDVVDVFVCVCVCGTGGGGGGCDLMACCCASNHITIILNIQHYTVRLIRNAQHVWTLSHLLVISSPALQLNLPTEPQEASKTAHSKSTTDWS